VAKAPASSGQKSAKKAKTAAADGDDDDDDDDGSGGEAIPFVIPPRRSCADWPAWAELADAEARNALCVSVIEKLFDADEDVEDVFGFPVPEDTPGYDLVCPNAMDLGTAHDKAELGAYESMAAFRADLKLVVDNCLTFNADGSEFFKMAADLPGAFHAAYLEATAEALAVEPAAEATKEEA
jgi:hypothetical protein